MRGRRMVCTSIALANAASVSNEHGLDIFAVAQSIIEGLQVASPREFSATPGSRRDASYRRTDRSDCVVFEQRDGCHLWMVVDVQQSSKRMMIRVLCYIMMSFECY